jgi:predicted permease
MSQFLNILLEIQLPILVLIVIGFVFQKALKVDVKTFAKVMIYLLIPVVIFVKIYDMDFTWGFFLAVAPFMVVIEFCMYFTGRGLSRLFKYPKSKNNALNNSMVLFNTGNYGIPLIELVFKSNPIATASQLFIVVVQNITSNTFCVFQASAGSSSKKEAWKNVLKMPALYVLLLVAIVKSTHFTIPQPLLIPLDYLANAFIGMALLMLGMQLATVTTRILQKDVIVISLIKLLLPPLLAFGFISAFGITGILAQALVIGVSTPAAVNTVVLAREFDNEPDFAAQIVVITTVLCTFTLPVIIYLMKHVL